MARACYRKADIYLLDDPLCVVDAQIDRFIFEKCIGPKSQLQKLNATRILVTHHLYNLEEADWLIEFRNVSIKESLIASKGLGQNV